jgi:4'-phosphopantetheinyl transferase EntD
VSFDLPHGRCVAVAIPAEVTAELLARLHPEERRHLAGLPEGRQPSFAAGRAALRTALTELGLPSEALLPDERGAPSLPAGVLGSISHKRTLAIALAAHAPGDAAAALGVDLEEDRPLRVDISRRVLTEGERRTLAQATVEQRDRDLIRRFSLKEAFYKAVNPFVRGYVSFHDVEVTGIDGDGRAGFAAALLEQRKLVAEGWVGLPISGFTVASVLIEGRGQR